MTRLPVSIVLALAVAATVGFAAGYVFQLVLGSEVSAARQAVLEAQSTQRVLQLFEPVVQNHEDYKAVVAVGSLEELKSLQNKRKEATLRSIESFERIAQQLELPSDRKLAGPFLAEAARIRAQVNAAP